jgi:hypothetical protein
MSPGAIALLYVIGLLVGIAAGLISIWRATVSGAKWLHEWRAGRKAGLHVACQWRSKQTEGSNRRR